MYSKLQCFCASVFGFFFLAVLVSGQTLPASEIDALQTIAAKLKISGQKWNFSVNPCSGAPGWVDQPTSNTYLTNNLTCDCNATASACHVTSIQLKGQNLTGVLPDEFANLTRLTYLDLTRNYISGSIPAAWASLPLTNLALLGNRLSGTVPDALGNMTTLQTLVVEANQLGGPVPASLGNLINLQVLFLSANNFSGELPESLGNLKNMTQFRIDGNPITGKIPSFIGNWTQLQRLDLQGTALEGTFPPSFANLSSLIQMSVTDLRGGDGTIPPLQNMKSLNYLVLRNLSISGNLPDYIGDLPISVLDLSYNNLSGSIPSTFADLQNSINFLYLANNLLSGVVPSWILSSNKNFDLSYNNFTEPPLSICQQGNVNLVSSYSSTNNSNAIVPCLQRNLPCLGKRKNYNLFINCGGDAVTIDGNEYEADKISQGQSTYSATSNKWAYSSMGRFMDNGKVSTYIATNVSTLNMTNPELYTNARLTAVSLRYYGLCLQKGNYTVKLHFAEIIYTNDHTYSSVGRRLFDVFIQGQKVLQDFDITKEANGTGKEIVKTFTTIIDGTLEIHFYWAGKGTISIPTRGTYGPLISAISVTPNFKPDTGGSNLSVQAILGIVAASLVVIILILVLLWCCFKRRLSENEKLRRSLESQTGYFSLKQIKVATKNFDPGNKIGEGGFGPVYKGVLPDKLEIAVKQLSAKSKQGNREFVNEIGMISALQHPNLVKLLGCCIEGNQLLLIYEYMENNSLARALFGPERNRLKLDWQTRFKICLDVARGLAFLHEESRLKIVHRDIKATNILLDKDLNAKISDFGLARLDEEENTHISTRIAGTVGYMAPEYATRGYLTDKADVYSFGVVALEVVSGVSNTNHRPMEDFVYLLDWAYVLQERGNLLQLVDPNLGSDYSKEDALQMLNLALLCTNPSPTLRPTMSTVVSILEGKTPVQVLPVKSAASMSEGSRLKAFEKLSYDSHTHSISMDWPSTDSSGSVHSTKEVATSNLISDDSRSSQLRDSGHSVFKTSGVDRN